MFHPSRLALPLLSLVSLVCGAIEYRINEHLQQTPAAAVASCRSYVCDDFVLLFRAYAWQASNIPANVTLATRALGDILFRAPASGPRWADYCDVITQAGLIDQARPCFDRALQYGSGSIEVLRSYATFHLRFGERRLGLQGLSRVLQLTGDLDDAVFGTFYAPGVTIDDLLRDGVPAQPRPARSFLRYLIGEDTLPDARKTWTWMAAHGLTDRKSADRYTAYLIGKGQLLEAADVWASMPEARQSGYRSREFIYNGDFENELTGVILDWNAEPMRNVEVVRDSQARSGKSSLRVRFDGSNNVEYHHLKQVVVLPPGKYRFRADIRTDNLTTDQGVSIRITEGGPPYRVLAQTEPELGSHDWRTVTSTIAVPAGVRSIIVEIVRRQSLKFDNLIKGTLWLDGVSLTPAS